MKTKDEILKEAQDHFGVRVFANDDGTTMRIEHYAMDLWAQEVVKNNLVKPDVTGKLPIYELKFCERHFQMTNHIGNKCQKCEASFR